MRVEIGLLAAFLASCPLPEPLADCRDDDGDGYTACGCGGYLGPGCDCNDADPRIHPGAKEICNGIDDNCNGLIDEPNEPGGPSPCCEGKQCGDFGFDGGSCGACAANAVCLSNGQCQCIPSCTGRQCGDDDCGGSCGSCDGGTCVNHLCNCTPNCAGMACGSDGCGGSCGTCVTGQCVGGQCTGTTNAERWRQASFTLPTPRFGHAQADYESQGKVVVFGGRADPTSYSDTLVLDYSQPSPSFVTLSPANPPGPRGDAAFAFIAPSGPVVLFGGYDPAAQAVYGDTATFNGSSWTFMSNIFDYRLSPAIAGSIAQPTFYGGITYDPIFQQTYYDDDWVSFDGANWHSNPTQPPGQRYGASFVTYHTQGYAVLFGGADSNSQPLGDTWTFDLATHAWHQVCQPCAPPARYRAMLGEDRNNNVLVLFGGFGQGNVPLGDTWIFDGSTSTWTPVSGNGPTPRARAGFSTAILTASDSTMKPALLLTGGQDTTTTGMTDCWIWGP